MTVYFVYDTLSVLVEIVHVENTVIYIWEKIQQTEEQEKKKENEEEGREECGSTGPVCWPVLLCREY